MVEGLEFGETSSKGRPAERHDGSEVRDESGYGINEGEYGDHGVFQMPDQDVVDAFDEWFGEGPLEPEQDESDRMMTDGGFGEVNYRTDPRVDDGEPYTGDLDSYGEEIPYAGFAESPEENDPAEEFMGDFPM